MSKFEDMDALALRTIRTKVLTQTDFNRLCGAIITHSLCLTRLTHSWSKYHKPTIWDTIIPELIEFAHNNQNA